MRSPRFCHRFIVAQQLHSNVIISEDTETMAEPVHNNQSCRHMLASVDI